MARHLALTIASTSVIVVGALATAGRAGAAIGPQPFERHTITEQVSLSANGPTDQTLNAAVYEPKGRPARGIQVMIPGATYDHRHYDLKTSRGWVSEARQAAKDGWIAVAVDRLGTGRSGRPAADRLNDTAHARTIHELVTNLKATYTGLPVALVGHSLGSSIAIQEAATYKDVDALVVTGFIHHSGVGGGLFGPLIQPATKDPKFRKNPVPAGYLTSQDGLRHLFCWPFNADLSTVEADDAAKQTTTVGEATDFLAEQSKGIYSKSVNVPVLSMIGDHDVFFFNPTDRDTAVAAEPKFYPASPDAEAKLVRNAGHDLALHRNADTTSHTIDQWLAREAR
ncbi:alpha/beta hydrolase [Streptomyces sp. NPDC091217]|uniref:alpha/beta hydrolase n=1 Tax=Streptomyces sp. NPDC091217 TaxID=3365975 RepID=UPI00381B6472